MFRLRKVLRLCGGILALVLLALMAAPAVTASSQGVLPDLSSQNQPPPTEGIDLSSPFPALRGTSVTVFEFDVELRYQGSEPRTFELSAKAPQGWLTSIRPSYEQKEISAIRLEPKKEYPDVIKVRMAPPSLEKIKPGEYLLTVEAASGKLRDSVELKAVITVTYELRMATASGRLNTAATAGKESFLTLKIANLGSAAVENISFSSDKPYDWSLTFKPDEITSLDSLTSREVQVSIKPASKAIAGDYMVTITASSGQSSTSVELRVTVLTPTVWGWVGAGIIIVVIAALAIIFVKLGRR